MKLWMLIMLGYGIYRLFVAEESKTPIEIKSRPRKQKGQEHTTLVTYYRPRGGARVDRPKQLTEVTPKRDRGMFSKHFINNNTQEADYVEVD
jgi:hypothetical protein